MTEDEEMARHSLATPMRDRTEAGQYLAQLLSAYRQRSDTIVLALPRGGVPVAFEIATALELPLDLQLVRKLGVPSHPELAMGAIASGGVRVLNRDIVAYEALDERVIERVAEREGAELQRRERAYRGSRPAPELRDRLVILVDDGLATGATMQAAVEAVRRQAPARIVVAVPVGSAEAVADLRQRVDEVICPLIPGMLSSIGRWYLDFSQTSDQQVLDLLERAWRREADAGGER
ncbi:Predicted phosphoribosyltransferase [Pseudomonas panipatensis]|uniref:Predicted phosphoribosyltransferase n=2 Tax=Pseudomonas panipatensis TaxID=428992 RepID=A0A1G8LC03_9PSED|nr:Predicted phosphoribosyltransferase [Pseudomonas panipatensis]SMP75251.1 Predicted phosphoribosyltransferase [Pseudomonas panipatensis]